MNGNLNERKVILLGDAGVGKTSLLNKYLSPNTEIGNELPTVGSQFEKIKIVNSNGAEIQLNVWDTAGQEQFRSTIQLYLRDVQIAFICFDYKEIESTKISDWGKLLLSYSPNSNLFLVATKIDKYTSDDIKNVQNFMSNAVQRSNQFSNFFMTSAITGEGINDLFLHAANIEIQEEDENDDPHNKIKIGSNDNDNNNNNTNFGSNCC